MEIVIKNVQEKDIDFLFIREFSSNVQFFSLFLDEKIYKSFKVEKIIHSLMDDSLGETDITVILSNNKIRHALLIENKINAIAMPEQSSRYQQRGDKQVKEGLYNSYDVFIVAPQEYLDNNSEAKKYPNKISYERIMKLLSSLQNKEFQVAMLKRAIEYRGVYEVVPDKRTTHFNELYVNYVQTNYYGLDPYITSGPRGSKSNWPGFRTPLTNVKITHKSYNGYVDLRFGGLGDHTLKLKEYVKDILDEGMFVVRTGKTANIRLVVPKVYFDKDFDIQRDAIKESLDRVQMLNELVNKITYQEDYKYIKQRILDLYALTLV